MSNTSVAQEFYLPWELIDKIVKDSKLNNKDLKSCSLVAKAWQQAGQSALFHSLRISTPSNSEALPDYLCQYVRHVSFDFRSDTLLFDTAAIILPRLQHLTSLTIRGLQFPLSRSKQRDFQGRWDALLPCLDVASAVSIQCLILDEIAFRDRYSFHQLLSKPLFRNLCELVTLNSTSARHFPVGDGYRGENRYPWHSRSSSLRLLTIVHSASLSESLYSDLCDHRSPCDIARVCRLQVIPQTIEEAYHALDLPETDGVFRSLTHLKTLGNEIKLKPSPEPALPLLTHYHIRLAIVRRLNLGTGQRTFFIIPPFLDISDAAPNLQYVVLDVRDVARHGFDAFPDGVDSIIVNAPLPASIKFVVLAPHGTVDEAREALPMAAQSRPLEVMCAGVSTDFKMSYADPGILY